MSCWQPWNLLGDQHKERAGVVGVGFVRLLDCKQRCEFVSTLTPLDVSTALYTLHQHCSQNSSVFPGEREKAGLFLLFQPYALRLSGYLLLPELDLEVRIGHSSAGLCERESREHYYLKLQTYKQTQWKACETCKHSTFYQRSVCSVCAQHFYS